VGVVGVVGAIVGMAVEVEALRVAKTGVSQVALAFVVGTVAVAEEVEAPMADVGGREASKGGTREWVGAGAAEVVARAAEATRVAATVAAPLG